MLDFFLRTSRSPWRRCAGWHGPYCLAGCQRWWPRCRWDSECSFLCSSSSFSNASRHIWATLWHKDLISKRKRGKTTTEKTFEIIKKTTFIMFILTVKNIYKDVHEYRVISSPSVCFLFSVFFFVFYLSMAATLEDLALVMHIKVDESTSCVNKEDGRPWIA